MVCKPEGDQTKPLSPMGLPYNVLRSAPRNQQKIPSCVGQTVKVKFVKATTISDPQISGNSLSVVFKYVIGELLQFANHSW